MRCLAYVEQCLVPTLQRNDIVVMDNCRIHWLPVFERRSRKAPATLRYLPKYWLTSIQSRCSLQQPRHSMRKSGCANGLASIEQSARLFRCDQSSRMCQLFQPCAMLQYDRNPL